MHTKIEFMGFFLWTLAKFDILVKLYNLVLNGKKMEMAMPLATHIQGAWAFDHV